MYVNAKMIPAENSPVIGGVGNKRTVQGDIEV
jgi:hypothetical protein